MQILHLDLKPVDENYVELRYFVDNPNQYERRSLALTEIADLIELAERDYYVSSLPEDYTVTGRRLYKWLDGSDRTLQSLLDKHRREGVMLAIATSEKLAHLPWEVLHDGSSFLVQRVPAVVPVRWVSDSTVKKLTVDGELENRALQVLFMATSPLDVAPVLDFEAEEAKILEATARQPLALTVEESGCLSELGYLVDSYDRDYFDVLHLTGHATLQDGQPRFVTETLTGEAYYASAEDIAQELQFRLPKLIFLSGCRTGQAGNAGDVPSMAEELLKSGAKAVLGWGQKVLDPDATDAAAALYQELSAGKQIAEAVASTYQALIKNKARDWHLLRLYAAGNLPSSLVTPLRTRGRKPAPPPSVTTQFLDPAGKVKVPTRESFVGRRRQLQNCLRVLTQSTDEIGVLIHGMGGLGKSSLAARLCDRLPNFERVVWVGHIDEASLVSRLAEKLDDNEQRKSLQNYDEELKFRLRRVFQQLHEGGKSFLLVLDDFEGNLEPRNEGYVLQAAAAEVLKALVWTIRENYTSHRIIITCRYDFEFSQLQYFYKQPLEAMRGADLRKKFNRLTAFGAKSQVDEALKLQAQRLADGNPRLLEWLDKILQNTTVDQAAILNRLVADPVELREQVLAEALLQQMDTTMREMLSRGLVFELPVPKEALAAVCESIPNLEDYINRAVALGLLEVSHDEALRVPRILPVHLAEDGEALYRQAAEVLYRLWHRGKGYREEQMLQMHWLASRGKLEKIIVEIAIGLIPEWVNRSRFRETIKICQDTLAIVENNRILSILAFAEHQLGKVDQALEHYQQALKCCPPDDKNRKVETLYMLGILQNAIGQFAEAIISNQQSLKILEGIWQSRATEIYQLLMHKAKSEQIEEAIELYRNATNAKALNLLQLSVYKNNIGNIEEAIDLCQHSLLLSQSIGDSRLMATILNQLSILTGNTGNIEEAFTLAQKSLALKEDTGNIQGKAATLHQLASLEAQTGKSEEAIAIYQESIALKDSIGDVYGKAMTLWHLGCIEAETNKNFNQALVYLQQSWEILEQLKSPNAEKVKQSLAKAKTQAGKQKFAQGKFEEALDLYEQSLVLQENNTETSLRAATLHQLAILKANLGDIAVAITLFRQALAIEEFANNLQEKAKTLSMLGQLLAVQEDFDEGLDYLQKSLDIFQNIQSPDADIVREAIARLERTRAVFLYDQAIIKIEQDQPQQAITLFQQSLILTEHIGDVQGQAVTLQQLGILKANNGETEEAIALYQQSLALKEQIGDVQAKAATLQELGRLKANGGEITEAIALFQKSLALFEQIGNVQGKAMTLWWLGGIAEQQGNYNQALDYLQPALEILQRIQSPDAERVRQMVARVQDLIRNS
ncbi:MAG: tetratricopeptide repeat protein [Aulosira sp. ZfuVER01]|nr:tetratricopeptide repeat protein [Aulosira sp. ZfuVER01]MDZ8001544.1 tetratricopeptide repeat protein [Aulosira sp. DedVER01a]MDZ8051588.1 tetratricopeptide repeat protein [Aulosira sp. ZfuCHP01]